MITPGKKTVLGMLSGQKEVGFLISDVKSNWTNLSPMKLEVRKTHSSAMQTRSACGSQEIKGVWNEDEN